ncbi:MAG: hypothetical protein KPEEDBHJ_00039 [Anaerolineales bacterium]|nr:hypothetical protein [Anaerolineales bacterium]
MEKLTESEIRTLQLALDNMADDGVLDSGIEMLMALHNKLDRIAAEQPREPDAAKPRRRMVVCPECETMFGVELS